MAARRAGDYADRGAGGGGLADGAGVAAFRAFAGNLAFVAVKPLGRSPIQRPHPPDKVADGAIGENDLFETEKKLASPFHAPGPL